MAVTPAELLAPAGRLDPAVLWPGEAAGDTTARLQAYLDSADVTGVATADIDAAMTAWAYFRAYENVYQGMLAKPASAAFTDAGSYAMLSNQISGMHDLMDFWSGIYESYVPAGDSGVVSDVQPSVSVPITFTW